MDTDTATLDDPIEKEAVRLLRLLMHVECSTGRK